MTQSKTPSRDRLEAVLTRLNGRRHEERVFVKLYSDTARAEADAADRRLSDGSGLGPLDGRIVSIKDLFDVAGEPTLAGSIIRRAAEPATADAAIVQRLRAAGAVIIGKTHMTEFAFTAVGLNPHYPAPRNAIDASLVPGGSSSGAAVSVAEDTSEIAIGSDTGGSVRIPAALNGLVGFKPTARRVPLDGAFPLSPSLDSIGPLARTVAGCALADAIMAGGGPRPLTPLALDGLKLGIPKGFLLEDLAPEIARAFEASLQMLCRAGAKLAECSIDDLLARFAEATSIGSVAAIEGSRIHRSWLEDADAPVDTRVTSTLRRRLTVPDPALEKLLRTRQDLIRAMDERLAPYDLIVLPTTPIPAVGIASVEHDKQEYRRVEDLLLRNTQVANQFDLTAITLPMAGTSLPAGLMLVGRSGTDGMLLAAAAYVERLLQVG
ncbi:MULTISPECIES: amidase [unclassified Sinorhizobium]|uniref:amidase n=1 Tax=unclassified Sinorhizobium TaxID=2613772 RepID=UPI0024C46DEA|nr:MULTISPECIES: amidase [unclassified Sinorhizobium]MDK1377220.1 amidase [Sinorhizobium sp. 6-70]MDK1478814.1 amidase [Sinorhizobium sp. 6-117]